MPAILPAEHRHLAQRSAAVRREEFTPHGLRAIVPAEPDRELGDRAASGAVGEYDGKFMVNQ